MAQARSTRSPQAKDEEKPKAAAAAADEEETPKRAAKLKGTKADGNITVSSPTTAGTTVYVTAKELDASVAATAEVDADGVESTQNLKTDPNGTVQVFLPSPKAGRHSVSISAGDSEASIEFDVTD